MSENSNKYASKGPSTMIKMLLLSVIQFLIIEDLENHQTIVMESIHFWMFFLEN